MNLLWNGLRFLVLTPILVGMALSASPVVHAATMFIVNNDSAGEGFNDATAAAPVGGNTGTTVGQQRLIAFQHAANIWGGKLVSSVLVRVRGQWDPLSCTSSGGVLGSAGPTNAFRDFTGAPIAGTWYHAALANALHGADIDPADDDINARFNSSWGTPSCGAASGWYYGLDGNSPSNRIDFVTVLLHELGHGLGFSALVDLATGAKALGFNDAYMLNLENHGAAPPDYPSMTNAQRVAASIATGNLHWTGANVRAASGILSAGAVGDHVRMFAPNPRQSGSSVSHFDTALTPNELMEPSYTVPVHNPSLAIPLFQDLGWSLIGQPTCGLNAAPSTITFGQSSTLSWSSTNATGGTITPTVGSVGPSGSQSVSPTQTTTYNGAFTGAGGTGNCSATIAVNATIAVSASPGGGGTVDGGGTFAAGTSRTVTAVQNPGFTFVNWTEGGSAVSTSASFTFTLAANRTLVANFAAVNRTIAVSAAPPAGGTVSGGGSFPFGSARTVIAKPKSGYRFVKWTEGGTAVSTSATYTFTLSANRTLVANFARVTFRIIVSAAPAAGGTVAGGGTFPSNTSRTVIATPKPAFNFLSWNQGANQVSAAPRFNFKLTGNRTLVAKFAPKHVAANDLVAGLGATGLWQFLNNRTWRNIGTVSPTAVAAGDVNGNGKDDVLTVLPGGLFARLDNGTSTRLDTRRPRLVATGDLDNSGRKEVIVDFGTQGVFARFNNAGAFVRLDPRVPQVLATGDVDANRKDEVLVVFINGLWMRSDTGVWSRLSTSRASHVATGDVDNNGRAEVFAAFPNGVFVRSNNVGGFVRLNAKVAQGLAVGDFNGNKRDELLAIFANGLSHRSETGQWKVLDARRPLRILAVDLDNNGKDEIVADFAGAGLFARYNNAGPFVRLRPVVSQGLAAGGFD